MKAIAKKLVLIMGECGYVQKTGVNTFHHYKYATAADVLEKVNESCVKHGVATVANADILEWRQNDKNHYATVKVSIAAIDQDTGESVTFSGVGCGQDVGDKAIMKAETAATKYAWMTTLNIATGDDPEADEEVDKRNAKKQDNKPRESAAEKPHNAPGAAKPNAQPISSPDAQPPNQTYACHSCGIVIIQGVDAYSRKYYGKPLCKECQNAATKTA